MNDELPISIHVSQELLTLFPKLNSVINKLSAQLNFQTLTAAWYGDEDNILTITLYLELQAGFAMQQNKEHTVAATDFADDVICYMDMDRQVIDCYVAITDSEVALIDQHQQLLSGLMDKKLHKTLNLIAVEQSLTEI